MALTEFGTAKESPQRQARVRQARVNALADGPDFGFAGQGAAGVLIAKSATTSLNCPTSPWSEPNTTAPMAPRSVCPFRSIGAAGPPAFPKARAQSQFHGAIIVANARTDFSYCPMLEAATAFIVRTTDCRSPALPIFRRRLVPFAHGVAHGFFSGSSLGLGLEAPAPCGRSRLTASRSSSLSFAAVSKSRTHLRRISAALRCTACSASSSGPAARCRRVPRSMPAGR
jgi:hypothetical protein